SDVQVHMPVAVVVSPGGGLRGDRVAEAGGDRDVDEPAVSLVTQQRGTARGFPPAPQQQDVQVAVVVVIGVVAIKGPDLRLEARAGGTVLERAVSEIDEQGATLGRIPRREEDVEEPVAGEVVDDGPTRHVRTPSAKPDVPGDVLQAADAAVRQERSRWDQ